MVFFTRIGNSAIKARVDSGAKTSALHAVNIAPFIKEGEDWVRFDINPIQKNEKTIIHCESKLIDKRIVKSSSGYREQRYVIQTMLEIGNEIWPIEMTLTNRDSMGFRMLLGREAMSGRTMVDPEEKYVLGQPSVESLKELYKNASARRTGLKIGLLASNPSLYSNRRIMEAGEARGHEMHFKHQGMLHETRC